MASSIGKQHVDATMIGDKVVPRNPGDAESPGIAPLKPQRSLQCIVGSLCLLLVAIGVLVVTYLFVWKAEMTGKIQVEDFGTVTVNFNIRKLSISMQRDHVLALSKLSKHKDNNSLILSNVSFCTEEEEQSQGQCESLGDTEVTNLTWLNEEFVSAMVKLPGEENFEFTTGRCGPKAEDPCEMVQGPGQLIDAIDADRSSTNSTFGHHVANRSDDRRLMHRWQPNMCGQPCERCEYKPAQRRRGENCYSQTTFCTGRCTRCQSRRRRLQLIHSWTPGQSLTNPPQMFDRTCERITCFPGAATVRLVDGRRKELSELQAGDVIQTFNAEGEIQYERLLGDFHGKNDKLESYLQLNLEDGRKLEVSEGHLVFVAEPTSEKMQMRAIRAAALQPGVHMLLVAPDSTGTSAPGQERFTPQKLLLQNLSAVQRVMRSGVYAPFTLSGQIIVDGVAASSYALLWPESILQEAEKSYPVVKRLIEDAHPIMHAVTAPYRWSLALAALAPIRVEMQKMREGAELHWYAQAGQRLFETAILLPFFPHLWSLVQRQKSTCFSPEA